MSNATPEADPYPEQNSQAPTDGAVQVNDADSVTIQQGGQPGGNVAPGGARVASDEAK